MIAEYDAATVGSSSAAGRTYDFRADELALAQTDDRGVPRAGRAAEIAALCGVGARDASLGRIFEGHLNGVQLVTRCGAPGQRAAVQQALAAGQILGVWNTQDEDRLCIERRGGALVLRGSKTWASGAGSVSRPIVTAAWPDGGLQMCLMRMDEISVHIDPSAWKPLGMQHSDSFRVCFDNVELAEGDLIGAPGDYERQPWFFGGALRFAAVQTGIAERLVNETVRYLRARSRDGDIFQQTRIAEMTIAARTAQLWLRAGAEAWAAYDDGPTERLRDDVLVQVDCARTVVERAALDIIERAIRSVGARGLVEPEPFAGLVRDLQMYLRQPAPDAALVRVARAVCATDQDAAPSTPGSSCASADTPP